MADSFFPNRLCENSSLALTCPRGEEESIPLVLADTGRSVFLVYEFASLQASKLFL